VAGYSRLRLHSKGGSPVAFVEFQDVSCAAHAMTALQGSFLLSSDRGPIRIEYAKTKMSEVHLQNALPFSTSQRENFYFITFTNRSFIGFTIMKGYS
jgi:hypothetical protein